MKISFPTFSYLQKALLMYVFSKKSSQIWNSHEANSWNRGTSTNDWSNMYFFLQKVCYVINVLIFFFLQIAILHFQLAQNFMDGCRSKRCSFIRVSNSKCTEFFWVWLYFGLHTFIESHVTHHWYGQKTEQNHRQH